MEALELTPPESESKETAVPSEAESEAAENPLPEQSTDDEAPSEQTPPPAFDLLEKATNVNAAELAKELEIGELLCQDILTSLTRPGRDPREDLPSPIFRREILKLEDLKPGMHLQGTVLNVVDFGAFVDIGLHDTGLVHISRLADRFIKDPHEVVGVGDSIDIWVMSVDKDRRRVQLTAIKPGTERPPRKRGDRARPGQKEQPPRRDRKPKAKTGEQRRPGKRRDKRDDRKGRHERGRGPSKPFVLESKKEKKANLTKAKKEGRKALQTFGELAQFMALQESVPEESPPPAIETAESKSPPAAVPEDSAHNEKDTSSTNNNGGNAAEAPPAAAKVQETVPED